ncbi:MAG: hypothetical protein GC157_11210 [Frankiales bacterium]|nr:hypothetical protein [Frankiales bacterium]
MSSLYDLAGPADAGAPGPSDPSDPSDPSGARDVVAFARVAAAAGLGARWPGQVALLGPGAAGAAAGSLLGGAVEPASLDLSAVLDRSAAGGLVDVEFDDAAAVRAGLACGGRASILVQPIGALPPEVLSALAHRRPTAVLTRLDDPALPTRAPAPPGDPAYGDPDSPDSLARSLLERGEPADAVAETASGRMLVSVYVPAPHLVVVGSGALATALGAQLALLGWSSAEVTGLDDALAAVDALGPGDGVLMVDHSADVDGPVLARALRGGVGYVAALGSRRTQAARRERLRAIGVDEASIERLRGPAGLDIGSRTPAEIAVAIVAEMLSVRASTSGAALRDTTGHLNAGRP